MAAEDPHSQALSPEAAYRALKGHPEWIVERTHLHRDYRFTSFAQAMRFVNRVADLAETRRHHPNITVHEWCFVRLELYSHLAGGLSRADVDLALAVDDLPRD